MQHLTPNTLLHGGTYRITKKLGQGSFGITYLAEHTSLGKKVAIKEFFMKELNSRGEDGSITGLSDSSLSYNYAQKFRKEAQNLARMEHPNIVRVTDCFDENGTFYYVMDYVEGQNLNEFLKNNYISEADAISIIKEVAKALIYMHEEKRVLHLDLKPGNIMRRRSDGHIFLIDFGLSKHYSSNGQPETSTTIGLGTPGYAPVEQSNQAKNGEFRPTIDVYALGATLFKLLTSETPPVASELISDDDLVENKLRVNGFSGRIVDVIVKAMLPNVRKRTQTIREFLAGLCDNNTINQTPRNAKGMRENIYGFSGAAKADTEETIVTQDVEATIVEETKEEKNATEQRQEVEDILSKHLQWFLLVSVMTLGMGGVLAGIFYAISGINYYDNYYAAELLATIGLSIGGFAASYIGGKHYPTNNGDYAKWYFGFAVLFGIELLSLIPDEDPLLISPMEEFVVYTIEVIFTFLVASWGAKMAIGKRKENYNVTKFFANPFSTNGRIRRSEYIYTLIFYYVLYFAAVMAMTHAQESGWGEESSIYMLWLIPLSWFIIAQNTKRCHDLGHSGWWQFIPFYALWFLFSDSMDGENEYGENPKGVN